MNRHLFVYGTLLPEHAPSEIAGAVRKLRYIGRASVDGRLYDLGAYPGAVLDPSAGTKIRGRIYSLPDDPSVLRAMDGYEGYDPHNVGESLFVRKRVEARLDDGRQIRCWAYVYNRDPGSSPLVLGGDYAKYKVA